MQSDNELLQARLNDCLKSVAVKNAPSFIGFLSENELALASRFVNQTKCRVKSFGGYDNATRRILAFLPDWADDEFDDFPIVAVTVRFNPSYTLTHRDFLGALMGLGIARDRVGDIVVNDGAAAIFLHNSISDFVVRELDKVGRVGISVSKGIDGFEFPPQRFELITGTVASSRLDCVVSAVIGASREKSSLLINSGSVMVNGMECKNISAHISDNTVITVQKFGKYIVDEVSQPTKKGRLRLNVKKYI